MPELPEVETVRRFLTARVLGKSITGIKLLNPGSFIGDPHLVTNSRIIGFDRKGKQLSVLLNNHLALLFHLKMTGQLVYTPSESSARTVLGHPTKDMFNSGLPNKSTRVVFYFIDGSVLYFNDQRKFGWIRIINTDNLPALQADLGPDILSSDFTLSYFKKTLSLYSRPIKLVLLDQSKFAGIGNIYANDALWESGINPLTPANQIKGSRAQLLYQSVIDLMRESIAHGGSTARDNKYINPDGQPGEHQFHFRVYQKEGESCSRCGAQIVRQKFAGRSIFFCPKCQK